MLGILFLVRLMYFCFQKRFLFDLQERICCCSVAACILSDSSLD